MRDTYNFTQEKRGFSIASINYQGVQFAVKVFSNKLIMKMRPNQSTTGTIVARVQMSWSNFLLNELLADTIDTQEKVILLHTNGFLFCVILLGGQSHQTIKEWK